MAKKDTEQINGAKSNKIGIKSASSYSHTSSNESIPFSSSISFNTKLENEIDLFLQAENIVRVDPK